jgi:hypothetical protein
VYGTDSAKADHTLYAKAAFAQTLGIRVNVCGQPKMAS